MTGSASVTVNNGTIHVNSSYLEAVQAPGSGHITTATGMEIVGSYAPVGSSNITPAPVIHSAVVQDPLGKLPAPTGTGCPFWGPNVPSDNHFKPGIYTGGLSIGGGGNVTFDTGGACAGVYIIRGDAFKVAGSVNLSGSGLFFYIDTDSSLVHSGNGYVNFSPQTSGDYVGVLFFQARDNHPAAFWGGGANANSFSGVLYFPAAGLDFGGSGEFNITFIVDQFNLNGAGNVIIDGYLGKTAGQGTWALVD